MKSEESKRVGYKVRIVSGNKIDVQELKITRRSKIRGIKRRRRY